MVNKRSRSIRILIADDHPVLCSGLSNMLDTHEELRVIGVAGSGADALRLVSSEHPDLILLDLRMPGMDGLAVLRKLQGMPCTPRVVVLTSYDQDELIYQALTLGAQGYLLKDTSEEELVSAIKQVHEGHRYIPLEIAAKLADRMMRSALTPRETQTLRLLADGKTNKEIATELQLSDYTVRHYVNNIIEKLQVSGRTEAVAMAFKSGILFDVK